MSLHRVAATFALVFVLPLLLVPGCGAGGDGDDDAGIRGDVTETFDSTGGELTHPDGMRIVVPEGALSSDATFAISRVTMPEPLPSNILGGEPAFEVETDAGELMLPVHVELPTSGVDSQLPRNALGIYSHDGDRWSMVGGVADEVAAITEVSGFSVFTLGTGASLHKRIDFSPSGSSWPVVVRPYQYILAHPDLDAPVGNVSVAVHTRAGYVGRMSLPQGQYSFCVDWHTDDTDELSQLIYYHYVLGSVPDDPAIVLSEGTNDLIPPVIYVSSTGATAQGRCPAPQNLGQAPTTGTGVNMGDPEATLTWNNTHDLDLWVFNPTSGIAIGWNQPGPASDEGKLDRDDWCQPASGGGPEHIFWPDPSSLLTGTYSVWVHFYSYCGYVGDPDPTDPNQTSLPRLRLVYGNQVEFFPGLDVPELVMREDQWCEIFRFGAQGNLLKAGRDFAMFCGPQPAPPP
jgi:hypothetical protein